MELIEKIYEFKNTYLQINLNQFGLGFSVNRGGVQFIILFLYIGYHSKN